jgi:hypothetical protein
MTGNVGNAHVDRELDELVACTLNETDLKTQRERWLNLGENFGIARMTTDDGLRLSFRYHPQVEQELRNLVAVENDCCAWADWSVKRDTDDAVLMTARSKDEGVATLHTMFTDACFDRSADARR